MIQQSYRWLGNERKWRQNLEETIGTPTFPAVLLTTAKIWKKPEWPPMDETINRCGVCKQSWYSHEKEGNAAVWDNVDGTWGLYAWNKPARERWILHGITYMRNLNSQTHRKQSRKVVARGWGVGKIGRGW